MKSNDAVRLVNDRLTIHCGRALSLTSRLKPLAASSAEPLATYGTWLVCASGHRTELMPVV